MALTKRQIVTEQIREMIVKDDFPDDRLPGERELAQHFNVGRNTLRSALKTLEDEKIIVRKRKIGTSVSRLAQCHNMGVAGIFTRTSGHFYSDVYCSLLKAVTNTGYTVHSIATGPFKNGRQRNIQSLEHALDVLLRKNPKLLLVAGYASNVITILNRIRRQPYILLDWRDSDTENLFTGVLFDYRKAGYLAGKYLLEKSCRKPLLFTGYVPINVRFNPAAYCHHKDKLMIDGFKRAMDEGGIDPETSVVGSQELSAKRHLKLLGELCLHKKCLPDGFCSVSDYYTVLFMNELKETYGSLPDDIVFSGIGNTPWSNGDADINFTSVDLNIQGLVDNVLQQAALPVEKRRNILVEPQIIIR